MIRNADLPTLRAAWWTLHALRVARRTLRRDGVHAVVLPAPPPLPAESELGVRAALTRLGATCLEQSLVRQSWLAAHGKPRDVVIGVTGPRQGFKAHAWLDGDDDEGAAIAEFRELTRVAVHGTR